MIHIGFLRRLLGLDRPVESESPFEFTPPAVVAEPPAAPAPPVTAVACPNCGIVLDPPPKSTRLCPRCRRRIVVRHSEGRAIYLTEAAVEVYEAEIQRGAMEQTWTRQRRDWLQLGRLVGAPADRRKRIAEAPLSAAAVQSARTLYMLTVERAVRVARRDKEWQDVARLRRRQATALFDEAGGSVPPADEIVALHREGMVATLRELATVSRAAELVGASCCPACRADDERVFRIADELRTPRLPHAGCPRGLCACDWWPAVRMPVSKRRRRASGAAPAAAVDAASARVDDAPETAEEI
ncbi:MAG TPA: hypothetical protein VF323_07665 [Candidatus Limnocylindrales bacterium]